MVSLGVLGERVAEDTKYNGLINLQGLPHKNYAGDLYNEHINKMFKVVKIAYSLIWNVKQYIMPIICNLTHSGNSVIIPWNGKGSPTKLVLEHLL